VSTMTKLIIGLTITDRASDYIPSCDGYRAGAPQDIVTVDIPGLELEPQQWAEAVFVATNAPTVADMQPWPCAPAVYEALQGQPMRALSIGDTVTAGGQMLSCERMGWTVAQDPA
jgi:hypothetical protein